MEVVPLSGFALFIVSFLIAGGCLFVPLIWLYRQVSEKHLQGVIEERDFFRRGISIFADLVRILGHNLGDQEIIFEGDKLSIGGKEFHFDEPAHMVGDHQERFLRRFFALSDSFQPYVFLLLRKNSRSRSKLGRESPHDADCRSDVSLSELTMADLDVFAKCVTKRKLLVYVFAI